MNDKVVVGFLEIQCEHFCIVAVRSGVSVLAHVARRTVTAQFQIDNIRDSDVYNAEEPLISFLEFSLVENLDGDDGRFFNISVGLKENVED